MAGLQAAMLFELLIAGCGSGVYPRIDTSPEPTDTGGDADTDADADADADTDADTDADPAAFAHTIAIDGHLTEWTSDEEFPSGSGTTWISWDADDLYIAVQHADVANGGPEHWVAIYLGVPGAVATTDGVGIGTQQPALPTPMSHLLRWKADDSYNGWLTWSGSGWTELPAWLGTGGSAWQESNDDQVVEFAIPRGEIGVIDRVDVHVCWVYEGAGFESSYAPTPAGSFPEGAYDPDYAQYWGFDLTAAATPASYAPLP